MKKFLTIALVALVGVIFSLPAFALEHEFSGAWYTKGYMLRDFTGSDSKTEIFPGTGTVMDEALDRTSVYTDTEIGYTAVINDNLKFVNLFEFEAEWGTDDTYGAIGDDGMANEADMKVRHSYVDFTLDAFNFKVGAQPAVLARGFLFDDNFAGLVATYNGTDYSVPFYWMKSYEGGHGKDRNDFDVDYYAVTPSFSPSETLTVNPYLLYITSEDASEEPSGIFSAYENLDAFYIGIDVDAKFNAADLWLTAVYQGGDADLSAGGSEDFKAWLAAIGASVDLGSADVHGQIFYATGDDDPTDDDIETFIGPEGQSYLWGLIMGHGYGWDDYDIFPPGSPGESVSNVIAANIGTTVMPMDKLTLDFDIWYARLAEDVADKTDPRYGEDELGTEIDLRAAYELIDSLTFEVVAGYMFAGDATYKGPDDTDPYMLGTGLTLEF